MPTVAVVGVGLVGRAWAMVFARAGWQVRLFDSSADQLASAPSLIREGLDSLARHGLVDDATAAMGHVSVAASLTAAVAGVDLVQENTAERIEVKEAVFADLDRLAPPDAILASSTSAIVASKFTAALAGRARCLVAHPVNPPHLVPLVELCGAPWTDPQAMARARAIYEGVGQVPVVVHREIEGFVLNRLQGALLAEAFRLVEEGLVSPHDLDKTVKDGLGLRWAFMGPFETIELNAPGGIADYCARYTDFYRRLAGAPAGPEVYAADRVAALLTGWDAIPAGAAHAARSQWRDAQLAALRAHKAAQG